MADVRITAHPGLLVEADPRHLAGGGAGELHPQLVRPPTVRVLRRGVGIAPDGVDRRSGAGGRRGGDVAGRRGEVAAGGEDAVFVRRARGQARILVARGPAGNGGELGPAGTAIEADLDRVAGRAGRSGPGEVDLGRRDRRGGQVERGSRSDADPRLGGGELRGRVRDGDRLRAGGRERDGERMRARWPTWERVVGRQGRLGVAAAEVHGAGISGRHVAVGIFRGDRERPGARPRSPTKRGRRGRTGSPRPG